MAFSIVTQPLDIQPVYNKLNFIVEDGDYTGEVDFKYIFKTYVGTTLVDTSKLYPNLSSRCHFDVSRILVNYLSRQTVIPLNATTTLLTRASSSEIITYKVEFWVEYYDSNNDYQLTQRNAGSDKVVWNGVGSFKDAVNMTTFLNSLIYAAGSKKNFLNWKYNGWVSTEEFSSNAIPLKETDYRSISFMAKTVANVVNVHQLLVYTQTKTGTNKTFTKDLSISSSTGETYRMYHTGIGIPQLNATSWTSTSIPSGYTATISSTEDVYVAVVLRRYNGATYDIVTNALIFKIVPITCYQFDHYTVAYQAPLGGFGYINFSKRSEKQNEVKKEVYKTILPYYYTTLNHQNKVYYGSLKETIALSTDWLVGQLQVDEIMDMLNSPYVYLIDPNYNIIPVTIASAGYDYKKKNQDKLFQYQVKFEYGYDENILYK